MSSKLRIGVIFGGRSGEHEVSLVSASSVIEKLDKSKYEVVPIGITHDGKWVSSSNAVQLLKSRNGLDNEPERFIAPEPNRQALVSADGVLQSNLGLDVVFPLVHGTYGEDGTLQGLLELANIPYVGAGVLASSVGMDKIVQKQLFAQAKLPIAKFVWFLSDECRRRMKGVVSAAEKKLKYPMFVKPANTGSSVGITKVHDRKELVAGIETAVQYDRKVIIEQGIKDVREIECSVLGNDDPIASIPGEIVSSREFYDYDAKYVDGTSQSIIPADLPKKTVNALRGIALQAYTLLDVAGMARVDLFVTKKKHQIYLNEINTIPGFTSISMYPKLWEASGIPFPDLLDRLIVLALDRHRQKNELKRTYQPASDWYKQ